MIDERSEILAKRRALCAEGGAYLLHVSLLRIVGSNDEAL